MANLVLPFSNFLSTFPRPFPVVILMNSLILGFSNTSAMLALSAVEWEPPREGGRPLPALSCSHPRHCQSGPDTQPRYSVRYFARNERAAAPRTLAAARPVNNLRNKDLASFFSCSETRACSIAAITFSIASVTPACSAALAAVTGCDGLVAVVRRSRSKTIRIGGSQPVSITLIPDSLMLAKPSNKPRPLRSSVGFQSISPYSGSCATARSQSRRLMPSGGRIAFLLWPKAMVPSSRCR
jgi:hypothetical protein